MGRPARISPSLPRLTVSAGFLMPVKNYSISAIVRDVAGNVNSTPLHFISSGKLRGRRDQYVLCWESPTLVWSPMASYPLVVQAQLRMPVRAPLVVSLMVDFYIDNNKVGSSLNAVQVALFQTDY